MQRKDSNRCPIATLYSLFSEFSVTGFAQVDTVFQSQRGYRLQHLESKLKFPTNNV